MAPDPQDTAVDAPRPYDAGPRTFANGYLFGVPVRDLGWFASILMGVATGMAGFFAATFLAIMALLIWNTAGHNVDYAYTYSRFGFWVGIVVMAAALTYLGTQWARRQMRGGH